jgi:hypothetical protein
MQDQAKDLETDIFICECYSSEHQFLFHYLEDENRNEVSVQPHLVKRPLLYRIKYAFKYIFGYKSRYGAWDEFLFNSDDIPKLQKVISFLEQSKVKEEKRKVDNRILLKD